MSARYWAVIPAAGAGTRMGGEIPKQYLRICGRAVIEHTIDRFQGHPRLSGVVVAVASHDRWWPQLPVAHAKRVTCVTGGAERVHSVLNALRGLAAVAAPQDWVLVHDAARPCIRGTDIDRMIEVLGTHPVGGILAVPVRDTMKRSGAGGEITATVERQGLWHALTPQMFRIEALTRAIELVLARGNAVTDEAQAMELAGNAPLLVEGHADNIKITRPQDLALAELYLRHQEETRACA